jgi:hypothetical protein
VKRKSSLSEIFPLWAMKILTPVYLVDNKQKYFMASFVLILNWELLEFQLD